MSPGSFTGPYGFRVAAEDAAVSEARRRIVALVRAWDVPLPQDAFAELELLASEVITNAVRYTRAPCAVTVRWTGERVRVEVTDTDPVRPRPRDASLEAESGRGLLLVETLATVWGCAPDPAGKVVWFEVGPPDVTPPFPSRRPVERVRVALPFTSPDSAPDIDCDPAASLDLQSTPQTARSVRATKEIAIPPQQNIAVPKAHIPRKQPTPRSTAGKWRITTDGGTVTSGYLPAWAEDDPTEADLPLELLPARLAGVNHRNFFEGPMMPLTAPDLWEGVEEDAVFEGSIDCAPYDASPRLRVPVVNLQICVGRWILGLDPQGLAETAAKLRAHADLLDEKVRPALIAAREDWAAHHPA